MISIVVCTDLNGGIGYKGKLLANIPSELEYFKTLTNNSVCVMGRKTFESILKKNGRPLEGRLTVVLSKEYEEYQKFYDGLPNVLFTDNVDRIVELATIENKYNEEVFICGGVEVYKQFIPFAKKAYVTTIMEEFNDVDKVFPVDKLESFKVLSSNSFIDES